MKSIGSEEFFKKVAINAGVTDLDTVKDVYYGMVRTIARELKENQVIKIPDWGEFKLKLHKSRMSRNVNTGLIEPLQPKPTIKFSPDDKVKKHFRLLFDEGTML